MKIQILILTILFSTTILYGQKVKTPRTITQAIEILKTDCPNSLQQTIKSKPNDSLIFLSYPWGGDYKTISNWTTGLNSKKKTKLEKYYSKLGINYPKHIETIVLISFKTVLNGDSLIQDEIIKPFQNIERKWKNEDQVRFTTDTLKGIYIPRDLEDCFKQIDSFWDDSTKAQVKEWTEDKFSANAHFGFGMWMRNNWQLWGGSALSKYFNEKGIYHPDDMSGIILDSYHRYLLGKEINLQEQIEYYKAYWEVQKVPTKNIYPKGVKKIEFNSGQLYKLKQGNIPGYVHIQTNSKTNKVWVYDYHFGWKELTTEQLKVLESTNCDNREETLRKLFDKKE